MTTHAEDNSPQRQLTARTTQSQDQSLKGRLIARRTHSQNEPLIPTKTHYQDDSLEEKPILGQFTFMATPRTFHFQNNSLPRISPLGYLIHLSTHSRDTSFQGDLISKTTYSRDKSHSRQTPFNYSHNI